MSVIKRWLQRKSGTILFSTSLKSMAFFLSSLAPPRVAVQRVFHVQRLQRRTVAMSATPRAVPWLQRCVVKNGSNRMMMMMMIIIITIIIIIILIPTPSSSSLSSSQHPSKTFTYSNSPSQVVTGAGSGIGRALSVLLASKGLHVVAVGRRQQVPRCHGVKPISLVVFGECGCFLKWWYPTFIGLILKIPPKHPKIIIFFLILNQ